MRSALASCAFHIRFPQWPRIDLIEKIIWKVARCLIDLIDYDDGALGFIRNPVISRDFSSAKTWRFKAGISEATVRVHSRPTVNTAEAAIDAAIAGIGVTRVLSYQIADALKVGTLITALEKFEFMLAPVSLIYSGHGLLPQKLRAFLDFARPRLRARLSEPAADYAKSK